MTEQRVVTRETLAAALLAVAREKDHADGRRKGHPAIRARSVEHAREAMGVDWPMTWREVKEAIPPAYTEWIGRQLLAAIARAA